MEDAISRYERLNSYLKLTMFPVAVAYIEEYDEEIEWDLIDKGFYRPKNPINLCQAVGLARHHSRKVLVNAEDMACKVGALAGGLHPFDESLSSGEIGVKDGIRGSPELCRELFESLPRVEYGSVKAIALAPLHKMDIDYDQVIFYGTPLDVLKIVQAYLYARDARLEASTSAKYGVCVEGMANCYTTGKVSFGFPCRGERTSSIVQDHEMFVVVPSEDLDEVIEGLEKTKHLLPTPMPFGGVDQEPILPDYYLTDAALCKDKERA